MEAKRFVKQKTRRFINLIKFSIAEIVFFYLVRSRIIGLIQSDGEQQKERRRRSTIKRSNGLTKYRPGMVDNQTSFEIGRNGPGAKIGWGCFVFIAIGEAIILIVVVVVADGSNLSLN